MKKLIRELIRFCKWKFANPYIVVRIGNFESKFVKEYKLHFSYVMDERDATLYRKPVAGFISKKLCNKTGDWYTIKKAKFTWLK